MLATTFGMCYAAIQPIALLFSSSYLFLSYLFYARGLLSNLSPNPNPNSNPNPNPDSHPNPNP